MGKGHEVGNLLQIAAKEIEHHKRTVDFLHQAPILLLFRKFWWFELRGTYGPPTTDSFRMDLCERRRCEIVMAGVKGEVMGSIINDAQDVLAAFG